MEKMEEIEKSLERLEKWAWGEKGVPERFVDMTTHEIAEKLHKLVWEDESRKKVKEDPTNLLPYTYELERRTRDC